MRKVEPFDKRLKERAKQEPFPLPETYAGKVRDTCAALKETNMKENKQKRSYRWLVGVAAALAVFVAIPNVSPAAAAAMEEIPVLGAVVRVITFRDYQYDDGHSTADVHVPELGGSGAADEINDQVQAYTDQLIAQFQTDCERELPGPGCDLLCGDGQRYLVHSADRCHEDRGQRLQFHPILPHQQSYG